MCAESYIMYVAKISCLSVTQVKCKKIRSCTLSWSTEQPSSIDNVATWQSCQNMPQFSIQMAPPLLVYLRVSVQKPFSHRFPVRGQIFKKTNRSQINNFSLAHFGEILVDLSLQAPGHRQMRIYQNVRIGQSWTTFVSRALIWRAYVPYFLEI